MRVSALGGALGRGRVRDRAARMQIARGREFDSLGEICSGEEHALIPPSEPSAGSLHRTEFQE